MDSYEPTITYEQTVAYKSECQETYGKSSSDPNDNLSCL